MALHLPWNDATNHHSATFLNAQTLFKQVEIDHVAKRNSCYVSAVNRLCAEEEIQLTLSASPCPRLILMSFPLCYCMWESVSKKIYKWCLHQTTTSMITSPVGLLNKRSGGRMSRFVPVSFTSYLPYFSPLSRCLLFLSGKLEPLVINVFDH